MNGVGQHIISVSESLKDALVRLDQLAADAILFVVDDGQKLVGSLTDGDVRRGLIQGKTMESPLKEFIHVSPKSLQKGSYSLADVIALRDGQFKIVPVVDAEKRILHVVNFRKQKSYLPVDAVVMAGGMGSRLMPLTENTPKPLLKVGDKAIIDHNIDRLRSFGIDDYWISVRYLGEQLEAHYGNGSSRGINVDFVWENEPLGTIGAVSKIKNFNHDYVLVTNSDILTNLNYEEFFKDFLAHDADISVATIPYQVNVPYAVLETENNEVKSFKEKPTYTYYSNGGIYLIKKSVLNKIPENTHFNSTDLMEEVIASGGKLISYPLMGYWLDVGKHEDFKKAQEDIKHIAF